MRRAIAKTQQLIDTWLVDWRLLTARVELGIEAARQPELAATLQPWRDHLLDVIQERLRHAGHDDSRVRAQTVVAALDGVLLASLGAPQARRRSLAATSTRLVLESLLAQPPESPAMDESAPG